MSAIIESTARSANGTIGSGAYPTAVLAGKRSTEDPGVIRTSAQQTRLSGLKVLLVGPYPPPHGGISVHVHNAHTLLSNSGAIAKVLNVDPRAPQNAAYIKISNAAGLARTLVRHVWDGWTVHTHINGHTPKSWLIALASAIVAQNGTAGVLTVHSGIAPQYLRECSGTQRTIAEVACRQFSRIICVNEEIASTLQRLGIPSENLVVIPAFLPLTITGARIPEELDHWLRAHKPVLSTAIFFRPEYGFELLLSGVRKLLKRHPDLGCLVMGSGEGRQAAEMLAKEVEVPGCIYFAGDIDHDMCLSLMSRSDVFIRPTLQDGDSISVREAVSLGIPVIASNVGTRPREAVLFETGSVDDLVSQMEKVLSADLEGPKQNKVFATAEELLHVYSVLL